ncbi:MAG TPA: exodeoxyribonuclease V subunit gamma [Polyangia bacterium]|nr:exodeoxyribonuclease V subunit gamma [Polyangia bacterium]
MIRFCCTNRLESLLDALADAVGARRRSLFDSISVVIPNPLVEAFVKQGLARRLGIAAHVESSFLRAFLYDVARASRPGVELVDRDRVEGELLALFHDPGALADSSLAAVRDYLRAEGDALDRKRVQLAGAVAALFDEYTFTRPEMLAAWRAGQSVGDVDPALQTWQRALWRALHGPGGVLAARGALTLPELFAQTPERELRAPAAHLFGISYVARLYGPIFAKLGKVTDLWVYSLSPSNLDRLDEPEGGALDAWARPGRENAAMLLELAAGDADARFVDPLDTAGGALATLQRRVLDRETSASPAITPDDTLVIQPSPDARRELEGIAAEIWASVRADPTRSFADFAVVVPPAAASSYLPLAQEVFDAASRLPCTVLDVPRAAERRIFAAATALLELPLGQLARPDVLRVAMHPAVARRFPDVDPEDWLALCEDLEIVRGADRDGLPRTYLERDRISWNQGLRRLALGAFLSGPRSGEEARFVLDGEPLLPAELSAAAEPAGRALCLLARELIAYADAAQRGPAPFADHAALLRRVLADTILPATPDEEAALGDLFSAIERAQAAVPAALPIHFRVASDLIQKRLGDVPRLGRPPEGVTVASFVPMRALPFHTIYVAGLDEGVFPSPSGWGALDLRGGVRRAGDVTPREQDQHMFLETLLAARRRLVLSYVARDPVTGDPRAPASVVEEVRAVLGGSGHERPPRPAARHADDGAVAVMPAAARERRAVALGQSLRLAAGGVPQLPLLGELRAALAPGVWPRLAGDLGWQAPPDVAPAARLRRALALADLRRFLECPLQASARVLLPIRDDGDADVDAEASLREHEPLDESRLETVPFLRELAATLLDGRADDGDAGDPIATAYDRAAELKRLDGMLADGLFGRAARDGHLRLLRCWRDGVRLATGPLLAPLRHLWLGGAPEHLRAPALAPAIQLALDGFGAVPLGGRTELVSTQADGTRVILSLIASVNPRTDCPERDFLASFFTHLALTVLDGEARPSRAITLRPKDDGSPRADERGFSPVTPESACAVLSALAGELVRQVHAYFLPCEGVFHRKKNEGKPGSVRASILFLRDDNWTRFASDSGPVPDPRDYPVPDEKDAEQMAARRFGAYFACIADGQAAAGARAIKKGRR